MNSLNLYKTSGRIALTHVAHINKPNSREFYLSMIGTEKKLQKEFFTQSDVTKLIEMYTKCIEYYDTVQDPIKSYFEDKISTTLSSPSVLRILMNAEEEQNQKEMQDNGRQIEDQSSLKKQDQQQGNKQRSHSQQKQQERLIAQHNWDLFQEQLKSQREKELIIESNKKKQTDNKMLKQNVIVSQEKDIEERLQRRKSKISRKILTDCAEQQIDDLRRANTLQIDQINLENNENRQFFTSSKQKCLENDEDIDKSENQKDCKLFDPFGNSDTLSKRKNPLILSQLNEY